MIIVGSTALQRADGGAIHAAVSTLAQLTRLKCGAGESWRVLNVLHRVSNSVVAIPNVAMRYVSRYLGHDAIRIAILVYRVTVVSA